jgi:hypothetical protein
LFVGEQGKEKFSISPPLVFPALPRQNRKTV